MADHERNFRTHYYEKVGFRAVEEKKSIEILLKEQPIKRDKLIQFCVRFGIPAVYRVYVWKIVLGILPVNQTSQEFVWKHREAQVHELERAVFLLSPDIIDGSVEHKMLRMKLTEERTLPLQDRFLDGDPNNQYFVSIARAMSGIAGSEIDLFWLSTRFFRHIQSTVYGSLEQYPEYALQCLKKEDSDQKLYKHLSDHQVFSALPLMEWFHICFANVLPELSLERVWDRIIGGSSAVLIYVVVAIFLVLRRPLLSMHSTQDMLNYLRQIPEDCGDRIVNEALELLHKNGGSIPVKPDSPASNDGSIRSLTNSNRYVGANKSRHGSFDSASLEKSLNLKSISTVK